MQITALEYFIKRIIHRLTTMVELFTVRLNFIPDKFPFFSGLVLFLAVLFRKFDRKSQNLTISGNYCI